MEYNHMARKSVRSHSSSWYIDIASATQLGIFLQIIHSALPWLLGVFPMSARKRLLHNRSTWFLRHRYPMCTCPFAILDNDLRSPLRPAPFQCVCLILPTKACRRNYNLVSSTFRKKLERIGVRKEGTREDDRLALEGKLFAINGSFDLCFFVSLVEARFFFWGVFLK